jgi:hypothetical protein
MSADPEVTRYGRSPTFIDPPPFAAFEHRDAAVGFEVAFFRATGDSLVVEGQTSAVEDGQPFFIEYAIDVDAQWHTRQARVRCHSLHGRHETRIEADGEGSWTVDGESAPELDGCLDVDLEGSSLTNAFPVRRLELAVGQRAEAPAAYVRWLDGRVERLEQRYERLEDALDGRVRHDYAAPRFDTRCTLEYDRTGVVLAYPGIAIRRG